MTDIENNEALVTGPLWVVLERTTVSPDADAGEVHADPHSRALFGVTGDQRYLAVFSHKAQAERFLGAGHRREALMPAALETTEQIAHFLEHVVNAGHTHVGIDRESEAGPPLRLVAIRELLDAARAVLARGEGRAGIILEAPDPESAGDGPAGDNPSQPA